MIGVLVAQTIIPALLVLWMMVRPPRSVTGIAVQMVGSVLVLLSLIHVGLWLFPPWWTPAVAAGLVTIGAAWHLIRHRRQAVPRNRFGWIGMITFLAIGALGIRLMLVVRGAAAPPAGALILDLAWPLGEGRFLVVNGGNAKSLNAHQQSMDSTIVRLQPWRGNGHAVDIIAIDRRGLRVGGFLPADPTTYRIFGTPVVAPCTGVVVVAVDGLPDMAVPQYDHVHPAGNHVMVNCSGIHVVLAHFQRGSVRVRAGEAVQAGSHLAVVGNSGGTSEPHLHIHAQWPGPANTPFAGAPIPIRLAHRYLIRGDRVVMREGDPRLLPVLPNDH